MSKTSFLIVFFSWLLPVLPSFASELMYVFFPSTTRAKIMQEKITTLCPNISVVVFGRQRDFSKSLISDPPNFILAPALVVDNSAQYQSVLKAFRDDLTDQIYYLVSINASIPINKLSGKRLGAVALLDAKNMSKFLGEKLKSELRIKRVTKIEDLLPLITFNAVDAIFVSESDLDFLRGKTELNLIAQKTTIRLGLATLAENPNAREPKESISCVSRFNSELNSMFGVHKWK